jgi:hypothetical protein
LGAWCPHLLACSVAVVCTASRPLATLPLRAGEPREVVVLDKAVDADNLKEFVTAEKLPLTIEFNQENSDKIFNSGIKTQLILWGGNAELEAGSKVFDAYKAVSKAYKGKLVFVTVNNEGSAHEPVTNFFGLKGAKSPVVGVHVGMQGPQCSPACWLSCGTAAWCSTGQKAGVSVPKCSCHSCTLMLKPCMRLCP